MKHRKIVLIGLMGAGKSTLGRQIAASLGISFYDTDHEIEDLTGATIPLIFDIEGEEGFRRRETDVLRHLLNQQNDMVIATGGGIVMKPENRQLLINHGYNIYLKVPINILYKRTSLSKNRPLLNEGSPKQILKNLLEIREPYYTEVANYVFESKNNQVQQAVLQLQKHLEDNQG